MTTAPMTDDRFERILTAVRANRSGDERTSTRTGKEVTQRNQRDSDDSTQSAPLTAARIAEAISSRVLHQPEATQTAAKVLGVRLGVARLHPERPHAFLLATGPTGTGKTTMAKAIAETVYDDPKRLIRLDCSELSSAPSVSALIGPPPGYVGFDRKDAWLTTRLEKLQRGVVLFDEVEKAHPDIWRLLLQIGDGHLSDTTGKTVSLASTTVLLTANVGAAEAIRPAMGFGDNCRDTGDVMNRAVTDTFPAEMLGRIDATLMFRRLPADANFDIAWKTWGCYQQRMLQLGWDLELEKSILHEAVDHIDINAKGARELERTIEFDVLAGLTGLDPGPYRAELVGKTVTWRGPGALRTPSST